MNVPNDMRYAITLTEKTVDFHDNKKKIDEGSVLKVQNVEDSGAFRFIVETEPEKENKFFKTPKTYTCSDIDNLVFLSTEVYKFAMAIKSPKERIKFSKSEEKRKFVLQLQVNDPVKVPKGSFNYNDGSLRRGFVKYVGLVDSLIGYHFIVTLAVNFFCFYFTLLTGSSNYVFF